VGLNSNVTKQYPLAGFCAHCNELPNFFVGEEYLDWLRDHQLLKKDSLSLSQFKILSSDIKEKVKLSL
jgi:hypothetical protein